MKKISILGSTGSIGCQTLDVARNLKLDVLGLSTATNIELLEQQAREFNPKAVAVLDESLADELRYRLEDIETEVYSGREGLSKVAVMEGVDTVVVSVVGIAGLVPTLEAIKSGKNIALANKETLVTAGHLVTEEAKKRGVSILPVDSEHSAIFQCLAGNHKKSIKNIVLTASGGPFREMNANELENVSVEQALVHPNWKMGKKITIDSATLMNKGLEVIEARWLFGVDGSRIKVVVHPQSVIHSMVEFCDGSILAQMGSPDMRICIQYALTYPERMKNDFSRLDLVKLGLLTFEEPDFNKFPCLKMAYDALKMGGTAPVVLNAANEKAVDMFLNRRIGFMDIPRIIENVLSKHSVNRNPGLSEILEADEWARDMAETEEQKLKQG